MRVRMRFRESVQSPQIHEQQVFKIKEPVNDVYSIRIIRMWWDATDKNTYVEYAYQDEQGQPIHDNVTVPVESFYKDYADTIQEVR